MKRIPKLSSTPWSNRVGGIHQPHKCTFREFTDKRDEFLIVTQCMSESYTLAIEYFESKRIEE